MSWSRVVLRCRVLITLCLDLVLRLAPPGRCKHLRRPQVEASAPPDTARRVAVSTADKRLAQREALALLMRADEAFRRCDPKYLECVDNYAYLCLGEAACFVLQVRMEYDTHLLGLPIT